MVTTVALIWPSNLRSLSILKTKINNCRLSVHYKGTKLRRKGLKWGIWAKHNNYFSLLFITITIQKLQFNTKLSVINASICTNMLAVLRHLIASMVHKFDSHPHSSGTRCPISSKNLRRSNWSAKSIGPKIELWSTPHDRGAEGNSKPPKVLFAKTTPEQCRRITLEAWY